MSAKTTNIMEYTSVQIEAAEKYKQTAGRLERGYYEYLVIAPDGSFQVNKGKLNPDNTFEVWHPAFTSEKYMVISRARPY